MAEADWSPPASSSAKRWERPDFDFRDLKTRVCCRGELASRRQIDHTLELKPPVSSSSMRMAVGQAFFLSDRAAFLIKPAGGQCREGFTGLGEDSARAR